MSKHKRKHYNPFKMWGSYAGAAAMFAITKWRIMNTDLYSIITQRCSTQTNPASCETFVSWILLWIVANTVGFLIGWGIHSLIRRLK